MYLGCAEKDLGLGVAVAGGCGVVGDWMLGWGQRPWLRIEAPWRWRLVVGHSRPDRDLGAP